MQEKIKLAVRTAAVNGSHKVKITFKQKATKEVVYLLQMGWSGIVKLDDKNKINLMRAVESGAWSHDDIRTTTVTLTEQFDESWFVGRLGHALEQIEAIS